MKIVFSANQFFYIYKFRSKVIEAIRMQGHDIEIVCGDDKYRNKIEAAGFKTHILNIQSNKTNPFMDMYLIIQYLITYFSIKPDLIFHSTIKSNIYGSLASRLLGIKTVNNISGLGTVFFKKNLTQAITIYLYKISQKKVHSIFFQNDDDLSFFINQSICHKSQSKRLPGSGISINDYSPNKFKKARKNNFRFIFIGRLVREKGILEYIEAAKIVISKYKNIECLIIGDFNTKNKSSIKKSDFNKLIQDYSAIKFLGFQDDVRSFMLKSECLVLPSWREGLSNVLLESCCLEIPVITTNVTGCRDVVINQFNGLLCNPRNSSDLAKKMEELYLLSEEDRSTLGKNGRDIVINKFNIDIVIDKYLKLLNSIKLR